MSSNQVMILKGYLNLFFLHFPINTLADQTVGHNLIAFSLPSNLAQLVLIPTSESFKHLSSGKAFLKIEQPHKNEIKL